jgi:hypothetical protein
MSKKRNGPTAVMANGLKFGPYTVTDAPPENPAVQTPVHHDAFAWLGTMPPSIPGAAIIRAAIWLHERDPELRHAVAEMDATAAMAGASTASNVRVTMAPEMYDKFRIRALDNLDRAAANGYNPGKNNRGMSLLINQLLAYALHDLTFQRLVMHAARTREELHTVPRGGPRKATLARHLATAKARGMLETETERD